jgi:predicted MPP superfamily phosphohydrolase
MLSGHTHGGQIYPFRVLVSLVQPYIAGLYQHDKNTQVYVNKGTGFWGPPMRLGTSCEITDITIS